jgi:DNA topoisomerase VI subunit B
MTGQGEGKFADVVAKELFDNGLDACETSGVAPEITLAVEEQFSGGVVITVSDNASGIPQDTMHGALDFDVLVSDKAAYRSPTRGAQGNALKTIFGIPHALGSLEPVVVEAKGTRHEARVWKDPAGQLRVQCDDTALEALRSGTSVTAHVPRRGVGGGFLATKFDPEFWARAFSLFNPHAKVKIQRFQEGVYQVNPRCLFLKILTSPPVILLRGSSMSPPIRPVRTGTTWRLSSVSSSTTSATTATREAMTSASETS